MDKVSILKRNGNQSSYYSTYAAARAVAVSRDVIQIWANLTEPIQLVTLVDIWIAPGVVVNSGSSTATISEYSGAINLLINNFNLSFPLPFI